MRLLITGASGYLGAHFLKAVPPGSFEILCLQRQSKVHGERLQILTGDLCALDQLEGSITAFNPDVILHLAALSSPGECEKNPALAEEINVQSTRRLAEIARVSGARCIFLSSDWVFDGAALPPGGYAEDTVPNSVSVYGQGKLAGEQAIHRLGSRGVIVRSALMYGEELHGRKSTISWMKEGLIGSGKLPLLEDEWRTPVFVDDVVASLLRVIESPVSGIFHCAGSERVSRVEFGEIYADVFGLSKVNIARIKRADVEALKDRPADLSMQNTRTAEQLGLQFCSPRTAFLQIRERSDVPSSELKGI